MPSSASVEDNQISQRQVVRRRNETVLCVATQGAGSTGARKWRDLLSNQNNTSPGGDFLGIITEFSDPTILQKSKRFVCATMIKQLSELKV